MLIIFCQASSSRTNQNKLEIDLLCDICNLTHERLKIAMLRRDCFLSQISVLHLRVCVCVCVSLCVPVLWHAKFDVIAGATWNLCGIALRRAWNRRAEARASLPGSKHSPNWANLGTSQSGTWFPDLLWIGPTGIWRISIPIMKLHSVLMNQRPGKLLLIMQYIAVDIRGGLHCQHHS